MGRSILIINLRPEATSVRLDDLKMSRTANCVCDGTHLLKSAGDFNRDAWNHLTVQLVA